MHKSQATMIKPGGKVDTSKMRKSRAQLLVGKLRQMDKRDRNLSLGMGFLMTFALWFALTPTRPQARRTFSMVVDQRGDKEKITLSLDRKDLGLEFEKDYPHYQNDDMADKIILPSELDSETEQTGLRAGSANAATTEHDNFSFENDDESFEIFDDGDAFKAAPVIKVIAEAKVVKYREVVLKHERYYRKNIARLFVPRLKKDSRLSREEFIRRFVFRSQPVIVPFEAMRHLGFTMTPFTLEELLKIYPNHKPMVYKYGAVMSNDELDLGPAVTALMSDQKLKRNSKGRNFPRNTKVKLQTLGKLGLQNPPFSLPNTSLMSPSLWFGTSTASTKLHADCCDNFALMVAGTKKWNVAPPSEARILKPRCQGGLCWVPALEHADEHAVGKAIQRRDRTQLADFELKAGEMLYLPTGWFHHVENIGPTIMVNFWTHGKAGFLRHMDGEFTDLSKMLAEESK